jgi:hypothetical protein
MAAFFNQGLEHLRGHGDTVAECGPEWKGPPLLGWRGKAFRIDACKLPLFQKGRLHVTSLREDYVEFGNGCL